MHSGCPFGLFNRAVPKQLVEDVAVPDHGMVRVVPPAGLVAFEFHGIVGMEEGAAVVRSRLLFGSSGTLVGPF